MSLRWGKIYKKSVNELVKLGASTPEEEKKICELGEQIYIAGKEAAKAIIRQNMGLNPQKPREKE